MRVKAVAHRAGILRHAIKLFALKGYSATSMREIAGSARVTKPTIYYYFRGKRSLYLCVVREGVEAFKTGLTDHDRPNVKSGTRLRRIVKAVIDFNLKNRDLCRILSHALRYGDPELRELAAECLNVARDAVKHCIKSGIASGEFKPLDPSLAAITVLGAIASQMAWACTCNGEQMSSVPSQERVLRKLPRYFETLFSKP